MLRKKKVIWKTCLLVIGALLVFYLVGCDHRGANEAGNEKLKAEEKEGEKLLRYVVKVIQKRKKKASWMI